MLNSRQLNHKHKSGSSYKSTKGDMYLTRCSIYSPLLTRINFHKTTKKLQLTNFRTYSKNTIIVKLKQYFYLLEV